MLSVPAQWRELYFTLFSLLCVIGEIFLVWYEIYRRDSQSDYLDIIMNILLDTGPVGVTAAILAFIMLKGRDTVLSTWETFAKRRYEKGRAEGLAEGREEGLAEGRGEREALARRVAELEESRGEREALTQRNAEGHEEREALARRVAELEEQVRNIKNSNGTSQR